MSVTRAVVGNPITAAHYNEIVDAIPTFGSQIFTSATFSTNSDMGVAYTFPTLAFDTTVELVYMGIGDSNSAPSNRTFWPNFIVTGTGVTVAHSIGSGDPVSVASGTTKGFIGQQGVMFIPASISATAKLNVVVNASAKVAAGLWRWQRHI